MRRKIEWMPDGWSDYIYWQTTDKKITRRINRLIDETLRTPFDGIGEPEPLRNDLQGFWSKRINLEHRLVYAVEKERITIISCKGHYDIDF